MDVVAVNCNEGSTQGCFFLSQIFVIHITILTSGVEVGLALTWGFGADAGVVVEGWWQMGWRLGASPPTGGFANNLGLVYCYYSLPARLQLKSARHLARVAE